MVWKAWPFILQAWSAGDGVVDVVTDAGVVDVVTDARVVDVVTYASMIEVVVAMVV